MVCPDIGKNEYHRTYKLAKILSKRHEVEIVGPIIETIYGKGKPFIEDDSLNPTIIKLPIRSRYPALLLPFLLREQLKYCDGDVVHAFKALPRTTFTAILAKMTKGIPIVVDMEDWEMALSQNAHLTWRSLLYATENSLKLCDELTVTSSFLQSRFGGVLVPNGVDTDDFNPSIDGKNVRKALGLESVTVLGYVGTIKHHKGVDLLIQAGMKARENNKELKILIVGTGPDREYINYLRSISDDNVIFAGWQSFREIPSFLAACDVIVIPNRDTAITRAQTPAKLFEAMALGKAIIVSDVGDMRNILEKRAGIVVMPNRIDSLVEGIERIVFDEAFAREIARNARELCVEKYSCRIMADIVENVYSHVTK